MDPFFRTMRILLPGRQETGSGDLPDPATGKSLTVTYFISISSMSFIQPQKVVMSGVMVSMLMRSVLKMMQF